MDNVILRLREVRESTGLSRSTIYSYIQQNRFPHQIQVGKRIVGWLKSEIDEWISVRIQASKTEIREVK